jgi:hypothetical protein
MSASTEDEKEEWIKCIKYVMGNSNAEVLEIL